MKDLSQETKELIEKNESIKSYFEELNSKIEELHKTLNILGGYLTDLTSKSNCRKTK